MSRMKFLVLSLFFAARLFSHSESELSQNFYMALKTSDMEQVLHLIDIGASLERQTWVEEYPIIVSVENNHYDLSEFILTQGVDPNVTKTNGTTPLMYALRNKNIQMASLLLSYGADVNAQSFDGLSALTIAVASNNMKMIELILDQPGVDLNINSDNPQMNPMVQAIVRSNGSAAKLLMERGLKVNGLMLDALAREIKKYRPKYRNIASLVEMAGEYGIDFIAMGSKYHSYFNLALSYNALGLMKLLPEMGFDVNETSYMGKTVLMNAAIGGNLAAVELLVRLGADPNVLTVDSYKAVDLAKQMGHKDIVSFLAPRTKYWKTEIFDSKENYQERIQEAKDHHYSAASEKILHIIKDYTYNGDYLRSTDASQLMNDFIDKAISDFEKGDTRGITKLYSLDAEVFLITKSNQIDMDLRVYTLFEDMISSIREHRKFLDLNKGKAPGMINYQTRYNDNLGRMLRSVRTFRAR